MEVNYGNKSDVMKKTEKTKYSKCGEFIMMESPRWNVSVLINLYQDLWMGSPDEGLLKPKCFNNDFLS